MPHWSGDEGSDVYGGDVMLPRTGLDESLHVLEDGVVGTISPGDPCCGTGKAAETPRETVVDSDCRDAIQGTLGEVQMCRVDPRLVSELCCERLHAVSAKFLQKQICFSDRRAGKHSFMFDEGTSTTDLCHPGIMCKLDCLWLSPYLFVCLGGWPVGIQAQPDLANIRGFCWAPGGSHPALFGGIVDCFPYKIALVACLDLTPEFARTHLLAIRSYDPVWGTICI